MKKFALTLVLLSATTAMLPPAAFAGSADPTGSSISSSATEPQTQREYRRAVRRERRRERRRIRRAYRRNGHTYYRWVWIR